MIQSTAGVPIEPTAIISKSKAFTIAAHVTRVLLGLIFLVFGLNGFLHFIPMPPLTGKAGEFLFGLIKAPYIFPLISSMQIISGVLLLSGSLVPIALLLLFPIALNIFLFHLTLSPSGLGMAGFIIAAIILLVIYYWPVYKSIFKTENAWKIKELKKGNEKFNQAWMIF